MGTEFFDELGETITRTAKELGERAEVIYGSQKIRNKLSGEERIIDKIMADMGNLVYKRHSAGETVDEELSALCEEIDQHSQKIMEYKESMADLKGQKICPSCQKPVDKDVVFCPFCGGACPVPEPEEDAGDVVEPGDMEDEDAGCGSEEVPDSEAAGSDDAAEGACCGSAEAPNGAQAEEQNLGQDGEEPVADRTAEDQK